MITKENVSNNVLPAVNFTEFCKESNLKQIQKALKFYNEEFNVEKVLKYFLNWELKHDDSQYRAGKILTNKHSNGKWKTTITINDNAEYTFAEQENCWQSIPTTFSEFISDVLRYQDFELLLSDEGRIKIYGK